MLCVQGGGMQGTDGRDCFKGAQGPAYACLQGSGILFCDDHHPLNKLTYAFFTMENYQRIEKIGEGGWTKGGPEAWAAMIGTR